MFTRIFTSSLLLVALIMAPSLAKADGFEIFKGAAGQASNQLARHFIDSNLLQNAAANYFNNNRVAIQEEIKKRLGGGNLIAKGITLYSMNPRIGTASVKFLGINKIEILIPGNYFYFRTTQPTSLGKWADPAFETHFDLRMVATVAYPTASDLRFRVTSSVVTIPKITIKPRNVVGGVVTAATNVVNFFVKLTRGRDLIKQAADKYLRIDVTDRLNKFLAPVNVQLANLARDGYKLHKTLLSNGGKMVRTEMLKALPKPLKSTGKAKVVPKVVTPVKVVKPAGIVVK